MEQIFISETELWAYISKNADKSTIKKVDLWIKSDQYDEDFFEEIVNIYKLSLGNIDKNDLELELSKKQFFKTVETQTNKKSKWKQVFKYAAAIIFLTFTSYYVFQNDWNSNQIIVQTTYGENKKIELSDGSIVWLNSSSKLTYNDDSPRTLSLEGEAFFEVAKNKNKPFTVDTKDHIKVSALGTSFNIKSYLKSDFTETVLFTGKVQVTSSKHFKEKIIMTPNEKLTFNKKSKEVVKSKVDFMDAVIAWKEEKIEFRNKPFDEIANDISIQFNIKISFENEQISKSKFTGSFGNKTPINEILEILKTTKHFEFKEIEKDVWIIK